VQSSSVIVTTNKPTSSFLHRLDALPVSHQQCQSTEGESGLDVGVRCDSASLIVWVLFNRRILCVQKLPPRKSTVQYVASSTALTVCVSKVYAELLQSNNCS